MLILTKMQVVFDQLPYKISRTCDQSLGEEPFRSQPELSEIMQYFKMDFRTYCCQVYVMPFKHLLSESMSSHVWSLGTDLQETQCKQAELQSHFSLRLIAWHWNNKKWDELKEETQVLKVLKWPYFTYWMGMQPVQ